VGKSASLRGSGVVRIENDRVGSHKDKKVSWFSDMSGQAISKSDVDAASAHTPPNVTAYDTQHVLIVAMSSVNLCDGCCRGKYVSIEWPHRVLPEALVLGSSLGCRTCRSHEIGCKAFFCENILLPAFGICPAYIQLASPQI
jgi:hypothetical protein